MGKVPTIIEAIESPKLFGPAIGPLESWSHWLTFLRTLYGLPFSDPEDAAIFQSCTGRTGPLATGYSEAYALVGRRGGKSRMAAIIAAYEAILGPWSERLSAGERGWVFIVATDKRQAGICLDYIRSILALFPDMVEKSGQEEIHLKNNISIGLKTCTFRASRGYTTCFVVADELAFWRDENSANPAEEIINSILPGLMPGAKLVGISTPYGRLGYLWEIHKNYWGKDSDLLCWKASTRFMNPKFEESVIRRLIARDPSVFRAEFEGEFREDIESFLPLELITAAMTRDLSVPDLRNRYVAFCDPSGGRQDSMTLAIAHTEGEKICLDRCEEVKSPFDPCEVVKEFAGIMKAFGISSCTTDRFGGVWVEDAFKKQGIRTEMSDLSASDIYLESRALLSMGRVELLKSERLQLQLQQLERRTAPGGRDRVDHPAGGHDDVANACCGAVVYVQRNHPRTLAEMEKYLPIKSEHRSPLARAKSFEASAEEEMRDFMGGSRIIR